MRAYVPAYEIQAPPDLSAALDRMSSEPNTWKPFAGGTDLMVLLEAGKLPHTKYLSIWHLPELRGNPGHSRAYHLGAAATYTQIRRHDLLAAEFPLLCRAAAETGSIATQNRGTLGGNIANASPAADSPPALIVYDAELELVSSRGSRWVAYQDFHTGYKQSLLQAGRTHRVTFACRAARAPGISITEKLARAAPRQSRKSALPAPRCVENGKIADVRIALGSIAPTVLRAAATERLLQGAQLSPALSKGAQEALAREIAPIDDMRSTARYRRRVAQNLLAEFLEKLSA